MDRRILLHVDERILTPPLSTALVARGLEFQHLDGDVPDAALACVIPFYDCLKHPTRVWRLKRRLARDGVPLIAWNRDAPHYMNFDLPRRAWRLWLADRVRLLDIYATHTLIDSRRSFAGTVLYLPNAADISRYHLGGNDDETLRRMRNPATYEWDVSFFGGMNGDKYKEDRERAEFFAALAQRLRGRDVRFRFIDTVNEGLSLPDQVALIQSSKINLNFGARCEYGAMIPSGLPERCYGIPACGGFLLCDRRTHAATDFTPGHDWAEFDGLDDCAEKIDDWLKHFDAARNLAERCYHHVMSHHTYTHRAKKLHEALLSWHDGRRGLIQ
jgi:spore maturation protein CgeB